MLGVWAAPGGRETFQKCGGRSPQPLWRVSRPPGAAQTPNTDDFRSVKKSYIENPGAFWAKLIRNRRGMPCPLVVDYLLTGTHCVIRLRILRGLAPNMRHIALDWPPVSISPFPDRPLGRLQPTKLPSLAETCDPEVQRSGPSPEGLTDLFLRSGGRLWPFRTGFRPDF